MQHDRLITGRVRALVEQVAVDPPSWAAGIRPRPEPGAARDRWEAEVGVVVAYRDQFRITDDADPLGAARVRARGHQHQVRLTARAAWQRVQDHFEVLDQVPASANERLRALTSSQPTTVSRADDVAVVLSGPEPLSLVEAIDQWGREARDTIRSSIPSARDLQGLASDLSRLATHSRAIVRAAVGERLLDPELGEGIDQALAESAAGWLEIAEHWTAVHTAQPPTPSKIATSHALGQALIAVTRHGRE